MKRRQKKRAGITLLEIVLALGLTAMAISLLAQLVTIGNRAAAVSRDSSKAQIIAESMLADCIAGILPLESTSGTWELDSGWQYEIDVSAPSDTMNVVRVSVQRAGEVARPVVFNLTQWVYVPPEEESTGTEGAL